MIAALLGFLTSFVPDLLGFFKKRQDNAHELKMLGAQAKHAKELKEMDIRGTLEGIQLSGLFETAISEIRATYEQQKMLLQHDKGLGDEMSAFTHRVLNFKPEGWLKALWPIIFAVTFPVITFVVASRYFVRAGVTWMLVTAYCAVKWASYTKMVAAGETKSDAILNVWKPEDYDLLGFTLGFWFGQRFKGWMSNVNYIQAAKRG